MKRDAVVATVLGGLIGCVALGQEGPGVSAEYKAIVCPAEPSSGTWAVLDFDGAGRSVDPYLSSLAGGERGTGRIVSPPVPVTVEEITLTLCGHDGRGGGRQKNFVALVDAQTDDTLRKTMAPGSDPLQEQSWDVAELRGRTVRVEVHDGLADGAFAWIGMGRVDAGPPLRVDFRRGLPDDWEAVVPPEEDRFELVVDGVPFRRRADLYSLIPREGECEIRCGFRAERLFFLGCTVARGEPLETYGTIELVYRDGPAERFPLTFGHTLDQALKLPSPSKAMYLHASGDVFQHYLVIGPRPEVIEKIVLRRSPEHDRLPRLTAVTCQTPAESDRLAPLPACRPDADEAAWIASHTITADRPDRDAIADEIRRAHKAGRQGKP